jgi:hypothetical protein
MATHQKTLIKSSVITGKNLPNTEFLSINAKQTRAHRLSTGFKTENELIWGSKNFSKALGSKLANMSKASTGSTKLSKKVAAAIPDFME